MNGFSQEIVFVVLAGAVLLIQLLVKVLRRKTPSMPAEVVTEPTAVSAPERVVDVPFAVPVSRTPPELQALRPRPMQPVRAGGVRRFSRAALLGDRRAVQDAVVLATILQPCHALRPHEPG